MHLLTRIFSRRLSVFLASLFLSLPLLQAAKPVQVLMLGHYASRDFEPWWPKFREACAKQGVEVYLHHADTKNGLEYDVYTDEVLRQFDVVVFSGLLEKTSNTATSEEGMDAFRKRLDAYYRAGGGIMWVPTANDHWGTRWNKFVGDRYDAQSLEEDIYDPAKTVDVNPTLDKAYYRYIWTTNIAEHPVTEGVRGLFLPVLGEWSWPGTVPMKFGKSWTPLIRGMESTGTIGNAAPPDSGQRDFKPEVKGSYAAAPEIVGVRESVDGSGRMMVFPFHTTHTWKNFNHFAFNDAMMLNGSGGHASDGLKLFLNACKWLAAPAEKAGLGGYNPPQVNQSPSLTPLDWSKAAFPDNAWSGMGTWWYDATQVERPLGDPTAAKLQPFRGLIGVRTVASDGTGTVAEYVAEARKQGLSYIIFLEDLEKTDEQRFARLIQDCQDATDDSFVASPGFMYRDQGGNLQFAFDVKVLPLKDNLTKDGRVIAPNNIVDQHSWSNGQGIAEIGKLKVDLAYLFLFSCIAPYVYEADKLVDDGFAKYCYSEGLGHQYAPVSLTIVRSPAEIAQTLKSAHITVIHGATPAAYKKCLGRNSSHPTPVYLTNGPVIQRWGALNPLGHPFWPGKNRVRYGLEAASEVGITDVKIIDATTGEVFRHFKPDGAKEFSFTVDDTHKLQRYLIPVVTDSNGRTAIGSGLVTYQDGHRIWMMGDRLMGLHHGMGWDEKHQKLVKTGGWIGHPWTKPYEATGSAPPNPRISENKIQGLDGGSVHPSAIDISPSVTTDAGTEPLVPAYRFRPSLSSFDYAVMDYLGDSQFLVNKRKEKQHEGWWATPDPQVPNPTVDITERVWAVRSRDMADVSSNIHELTVTFKKSARFDRLRIAGMRSGREKIEPLVMLKDQEGEFAWIVGNEERFNRAGILPPGGYLFPANYRGGAVGIINLGPQPINYTNQGRVSQIFVDGEGRQMKAGDKITVRFLVFTRPWQGQMNNHWLKKFISDFGIEGKPGYAFEVTQGKLISSNYSLDLEAQQGGVTVKVGKYDLPHNLAVRVRDIPSNAIAGRYDLEDKQLLILPVFEGGANTSISTNRKDISLYVGELFHCDDSEVRLSATQDGEDKLLLETHNPTDKPRKVTLSSVEGFPPLKGLNETFEVPAYSSDKRTLQASKGSLDNSPYKAE